eukprot:g2785.t1
MRVKNRRARRSARSGLLVAAAGAATLFTFSQLSNDDRSARSSEERFIFQEEEIAESLESNDAAKEKMKKKKKKSETDPLKYLLNRERIVFLTGRIDKKSSDSVVAKLLYLSSKDSKTPIRLVINSGGGEITSGFAIYDAMKHAVRAPVHTIVLGKASSMATILLAAGEPGHRSAYPHSRIMIHEASGCGGNSRKVPDARIRLEELKYKNDMLIDTLSNDSGVPPQELQQQMDRDKYLSPADAIAMGFIDRVEKSPLSRRSKERKKTEEEEEREEEEDGDVMDALDATP